LAFSPLHVLAQSAPPALDRVQFGIGYIGNAPEEMAGGGAYVLLPRAGGIGIYVDAKFDIENRSSDRGFEPDLTASQIEGELGGKFVKKEGSWWSANAAFIRPVTPYMMAYGGAGIAHRTLYRLYDEAGTEVGQGGVVWAEDPEAEENRVNLMAGIMLRLTSRVTTHFGFETQPRGVTVGATLRIPSW
jgi:hypothetical protein